MTQAGDPEEKLDLAFRLYDIDRNGTIDMDEMTEIIKVLYVHTYILIHYTICLFD